MQKRNPRSGYAVLMIFSMAAIVAIMLYMQLPRAAFEAQRDREQLLIDHGKQYSRAIAVYVRKLKKFPPTLEALENTNNMRFLRRRYKDPMTGKDEWRLIHVGPNGVFTDSLVYGKKDRKAGDPQSFITEMQQVGGTASTGDAGVNLAMRRRPSDGPGAPGTGDPAANTGTNLNPQTANQGPMQVLPDGRLVPIQIQNGMIVNAGIAPPAPGQPSSLPPGAQLPAGVAAQQGQGGILPGQPGPAATSPTAGNTAYQTDPNAPNQNAFGGQPGGQFGTPPGAQPGGQPGPPTGPAADMIKNLLTSPRPGGAFGTPVANSSATPGQTTIGGGIGGVASNLEREGIKIYNERTTYNEWEFVYDMSKDLAMGGAANQTGQQTGKPGQPGPGTGGPAAPAVPKPN